MLSLMRYNPFDVSFTEIENMFDTIDRDFFHSKILQEYFDNVNVTKDNTAAYIHLSVAGFSKEDLKVSVKSDVLTISGKLSGDDGTRNRGFFAKEFSRQWKLGDGHNVAKITSKLEDGILTVTVPFKPTEKKTEEETVIAIQ